MIKDGKQNELDKKKKTTPSARENALEMYTHFSSFDHCSMHFAESEQQPLDAFGKFLP